MRRSKSINWKCLNSVITQESGHTEFFQHSALWGHMKKFEYVSIKRGINPKRSLVFRNWTELKKVTRLAVRRHSREFSVLFQSFIKTNALGSINWKSIHSVNTQESEHKDFFNIARCGDIRTKLSTCQSNRELIRNEALTQYFEPVQNWKQKVTELAIKRHNREFSSLF